MGLDLALTILGATNGLLSHCKNFSMLLILGILQEIEATNILPAYKLQKARII